MKWVAAHPKPMTEQDVNHLAFDFNSVKLKQQPDAVDLDPQPQPLDREELAKSSPDDRLEQALKEIRSAVADDVLENLLQVSPRFEVIVLDVLHRLGYGGHRDDLQRVGGTGDGGIDGVISLISWAGKSICSGKRWQNTVGSAEIRGFYGALHEQKRNEACLSRRPAFPLTPEIMLVKSKGWFWSMAKGWCIYDRNDVGVSSQLLKVPKLDMDYFE
jgi:restriction system protein